MSRRSLRRYERGRGQLQESIDSLSDLYSELTQSSEEGDDRDIQALADALQRLRRASHQLPDLRRSIQGSIQRGKEDREILDHARSWMTRNRTRTDFRGGLHYGISRVSRRVSPKRYQRLLSELRR